MLISNNRNGMKAIRLVSRFKVIILNRLLSKYLSATVLEK